MTTLITDNSLPYPTTETNLFATSWLAPSLQESCASCWTQVSPTVSAPLVQKGFLAGQEAFLSAENLPLAPALWTRPEPAAAASSFTLIPSAQAETGAPAVVVTLPKITNPDCTLISLALFSAVLNLHAISRQRTSTLSYISMAGLVSSLCCCGVPVLDSYAAGLSILGLAVIGVLRSGSKPESNKKKA